MSDAVKVRYEVDLSTETPDPVLPDLEIRSLIPTDREALARLMLNAFVGTIDYEGETLTEAIEEVDSWLAGTPMLDHSYGAVVDGRLVSAVLIRVLDGAPFIDPFQLAAACATTGPRVPSNPQHSAGRMLYEKSCARCHALYMPRSYSAPEWRFYVRKYGRKARLTTDQKSLVFLYLAENARAG